ncbi:MAG: hypothetical protein H0W86_11135 [Armatimonadetes bacterium]|nr:hypothetical protein [Armatimonadota bacterium]
MEHTPRGRIEAQGVGIGAVSDEILQKRARDLAEEDGRAEPTAADRAAALKELTGFHEDAAPEVPAGAEGLTSWNEGRENAGHATPNLLPDDEAEVDAELTAEGVDEADLDRRRAAKDENPR